MAAVPYHRFPDTEHTSPLKEFAEGVCLARFEAYVGIRFKLQSALVVDQLVPTDADWATGTRAVACLLKPAVARELPGPVRGSRQIFADDFSSADHWAGDPDNNERCEALRYREEWLVLGKGSWVPLQKKQAGLLCAATPTPATLDPDMVTDAQLSVTATPAEDAPSSGRMGFVCRENDGSRYHLTTALDGTWRIEKFEDGLITLEQSGENIVPVMYPVELRAVCRDRQDGKVDLVSMERPAPVRI